MASYDQPSHQEKPLTYQAAGVDIERANQFVKSVSAIAARTHRPGVLGGVGGFGALFELPLDRYQNPVLVSGTDGVGTKLKLATLLNRHDTIGIDLVAMCANDIITLGAEPLFFLDYFATGQLHPKQAEAIVSGIGRGCELAHCALIGGETAEMPGLYHGTDYDLAGFCVGIVEKAKIIDGSQVAVGDTLIALASSGLHSNGYSLVRRVIDDNAADLMQAIDGHTLQDILLTPTRIYADTILKLQNQTSIHAMAHITGGGIIDNMPRVLPQHTCAIIDQSSWQWPAIFKWLQSRGNIATSEMLQTFNVGVGMILCVAAEQAETTLELLKDCKEHAWTIGHIAKSDQPTPSVSLINDEC